MSRSLWRKNLNLRSKRVPTMEANMSGEEVMRAMNEQILKDMLRVIVETDAAKDYDNRNILVIQAVAIADSLGYPVGVLLDPEEPDWPVFFIELPTGQCSWHLPKHGKPWDGHSTEDKVERIRKYIAGV